MNATFTAARRVLLVFAAVALGGCAMSTGGGPSQLGLLAPAARADYTVCSGGHASRFPAREQVGRVCRPSSSVRAIL
jgi:hypothetical protein